MHATKEGLFQEVAPVLSTPHNKITIVGVGQVGMAIAYSLIQQNIASDICLVDSNADKLKGEMMDLQHGLTFTQQGCRVWADTDYNFTACSKICVITAGCCLQPGESRLSLLQRNVEILRGIVPQVVKYSPNTILLVVSDPVDLLTYVAWKLSGLPQERVFGSGTNLDSARFRFLLSEQVNIAPADCHGWIIGEHGDSSVSVWSGVNVAGSTLGESSEQHVQWESTIHEEVVDSAYKIVRLKGSPSWANALSATAIISAIMRNSREVFALSTNCKGIHAIAEDVYLSLPCVVGANGLTHVVKQQLREGEMAQLKRSAEKLWELQKGLLI